MVEKVCGGPRSWMAGNENRLYKKKRSKITLRNIDFIGFRFSRKECEESSIIETWCLELRGERGGVDPRNVWSCGTCDSLTLSRLCPSLSPRSL